MFSKDSLQFPHPILQVTFLNRFNLLAESNSPRGAPSANNSSSSVTLEPKDSSQAPNAQAVPHTVDIENLNTMNSNQENGVVKEFVNPQGVRFEKGDAGSFIYSLQ